MVVKVRDEIVVEWIYQWDNGTPIHRRVQTHLNESRKGNIYFELGRDPYVITDLKNGAPVLGRGTIVLGVANSHSLCMCTALALGRKTSHAGPRRSRMGACQWAPPPVNRRLPDTVSGASVGADG